MEFGFFIIFPKCPVAVVMQGSLIVWVRNLCYDVVPVVCMCNVMQVGPESIDDIKSTQVLDNCSGTAVTDGL